jgi:protein SCO1/2
MRIVSTLALLASLWPFAAPGHEGMHHEAPAEPLPVVGDAADFALLDQDGKVTTLGDFTGRVLALSFIYTHCPDVCPLLTLKLAEVRDMLAGAFDRDVVFLSVTVDPARDTPGVLKDYAEAFDADVPGWRFLTGEPEAVRSMAEAYGVVFFPGGEEIIDHTTLTTLVDRAGQMRVQYLGTRFDPDEFRHDLIDLVDEPG